MSHLKVAGGPLGLELGENVVQRFYNRTGGQMVLGDVAQIDLTLGTAGGETTTYKTGGSDSAFANLVTVAGLAAVYACALALETVEDNASGLYLLRGIATFPILNSGAGTDADPGDLLLMAAAATQLDVNTAVTPARVLGHTMNLATVADVGAEDVPCYFDGITLLGTIGI